MAGPRIKLYAPWSASSYLFHCFVSSKSKGEHDHPKPETKLEAEARRAMKKAHSASSSVASKMRQGPQIKVTLPHAASKRTTTCHPCGGGGRFPCPLPTNEAENHIPSGSPVSQPLPKRLNLRVSSSFLPSL